MIATPQLPQGLSDKFWPCQRRAIAFALKYLRKPLKSEVALVRMPTGTGKTGIVAALTVALPPTQWSLVLTPWKNLCGQMILDLESKFWRSTGWSPPVVPKVLQLYPSTVQDILQVQDTNIILVATFATLVTIFKLLRGAYDDLVGLSP